MDAQIQELVTEVKELKSLIIKDAAPTYWKVEKAAEFLSITSGALRVMVTRGQVPHIKRLGKLYFLQSDLIDWLESGRVNHANATPEDILIVKRKKTA
ncbi:helix-turn-helix domain-containing protein [Pedobacter lithocola]|uniref:Helix-turn-helix domain-containing protein n=1 Tax=Pedobacter lithocola TaxID=1908239 RepID=A0ABV8PEK5_9SPHI